MREAPPALPRQAAVRLRARRGRGAPRDLLLLPEALRVRGEAEDVRPAGRRRGDAARPEAEALRAAHAALLTEPQRAHRPPEAPELEVQVRPGARARAAGRADPLTGPDLVADADAGPREVRVERHVAAAERDLDERPVALEPARRPDRDHAAGLRGAHGERAQDADVDPGVPAAAVVAERARDGPLRRPGRPVGRRGLHLDVREGESEQKGQ